MLQRNTLRGIDWPREHRIRSAWSAIVIVMAGLIVYGLSAPGTSRALAFQEKGGAADAGDDAPDAGQDNQDAGDQTDAQVKAEARKNESFLGWMIRASGIFGLLLLLTSFVMVALIVMNMLQVRRDNLLPQRFIEAFQEKLETKDYQSAYDLARNDDSFLARVLAAGLSRLNRGYSEAIEGMQEVGEDENMVLEHRLSYLALIGSIAPMLGLMGTVYGMITSFQVIAQSVAPPKPSELADGISTALFTTLEGLTVAIPALIFYGLLRNRVARFVLEVGIVSEGLMSRFSTVGKAQKPGGAAPSTAPAARIDSP